MGIYTKPTPGSTEHSTQNYSKHRDAFARSAVLTEFRARDARALDQADFIDRRPNQARHLGDVAADVVGNVGQAALDHWLREAARTRGEEHLVALQIAQEIAAMLGVPWDEVFSEAA